jgi:hypothetical protein
VVAEVRAQEVVAVYELESFSAELSLQREQLVIWYAVDIDIRAERGSVPRRKLCPLSGKFEEEVLEVASGVRARVRLGQEESLIGRYVELREVFLAERGKVRLLALLLDEPLVEQDSGSVDPCQELLLRD